MGTGEGLSLTTFGLWSALAWITGFTMLKQGANPGVPMMYGVGATATTIVLLLKGRYGFTGLDAVIAVLVILCIILWKTRGARWALILSVIAAVLASVPFLILTWKNPVASPIIPNTCFLFANLFAFIAAGKWTMQDRLYTGTSAAMCLFFVIPWLIN